MASRSAPGPSADEALAWSSLTRAGSHPHRHHASGELLAPVACPRRRARDPRRAARAEGGRARPDCCCDRCGSGQRPGKAARAPASALLAVASGAHSYTTVNVISIGPQRSSVRVCHRRLRRAASAGAGPGAVGRGRCLFARAYRRSLPKRRRSRHRDRNRIGPAGRALAVAWLGDARRHHHFSSISSSRSSVSTSSSTLS